MFGLGSKKEKQLKKPKKLWYRAARRGWGFVPISWQGWLILWFYLFSVVYYFFDINRISHSVGDTLLNFLPGFGGLSSFFVWICYKKGERPRWSWAHERESEDT